jgi:hypothetical protein
MGFIEMKAYSYLTIESFHQFLIAGFEMCVRHGVFCWTVETDWKRMTCHPSGLKLNNLLQSDMWACINHKKENELNMIKVKTVSYVKYIPEKHPE